MLSVWNIEHIVNVSRNWRYFKALNEGRPAVEMASFYARALFTLPFISPFYILKRLGTAVNLKSTQRNTFKWQASILGAGIVASGAVFAAPYFMPLAALLTFAALPFSLGGGVGLAAASFIFAVPVALTFASLTVLAKKWTDKPRLRFSSDIHDKGQSTVFEPIQHRTLNTKPEAKSTKTLQDVEEKLLEFNRIRKALTLHAIDMPENGGDYTRLNALRKLLNQGVVNGNDIPDGASVNILSQVLCQRMDLMVTHYQGIIDNTNSVLATVTEQFNALFLLRTDVKAAYRQADFEKLQDLGFKSFEEARTWLSKSKQTLQAFIEVMTKHNAHNLRGNPDPTTRLISHWEIMSNVLPQGQKHTDMNTLLLGVSLDPASKQLRAQAPRLGG